LQTIDENWFRQYERQLELKNGKKVFVRPILSSDEYLILDLFNKLRLDSIYTRFLTYLSTIPEDLLFQLTHIDYNKSFALVALTQDNLQESAVAVARYCYDAKDGVTDLAVTVRDDWQHNGLGKLLLSIIISIGREHGISRFISILDSKNNIIKHLIQETCLDVKYMHKGGADLVEIIV